jgi:Sulfotransferase family
VPDSSTHQLSVSALTADWSNIGKWLASNARIRLELATPQPSVDVLMRLSAGEGALYRYFPFIFQLSADAPQAEIGEVTRPFDEIEMVIKGAIPAAGRLVELSFESELSSVPALAGIGPDRRDLALLLKAVAVRPASAPPIKPQLAPRALTRRKVEPAAPIFVIGSGRAGSSILTWAIGQHPNIGCLEETNWVPLTLYGAASGFQMASGPAVNAPDKYKIDEDQFLQHIGTALDQLHHQVMRERTTINFLTRLSRGDKLTNPEFQLQRSLWSPKRRWVDGSPINTLATMTIARAFPDAQFILTLRDPRQVIASYARFSAEGGPAYSTRQAAMNWLRSTEIGLRAKAGLGESRVLVVFNDDMLNSPAEFMRDVFLFLNEPNFLPSVETLKVKINTTQPSPDQNIADADDSVLSHCDTLYREIRSGVPVDRLEWGEHSLGDITAWERHLRMEMIASFSGDLTRKLSRAEDENSRDQT